MESPAESCYFRYTEISVIPNSPGSLPSWYRYASELTQIHISCR